MPVISVVGQKGGVGKSAISRLLAVAAIKAGMPTRICDLDPSQGTTTQWGLRRDRNEIDPEVPVDKHRTVGAAMRRHTPGELLILDGPAFADRLTLEMAKQADISILPTGFSLDDLTPQIEVAYELEAKGVDPANMRLVFCRAKGSSTEEEDARRFIASTGLIALEHMLREMPSIRQAHNAGRAANETGFPTVDAGSQRLAEEIISLTKGATT